MNAELRPYQKFVSGFGVYTYSDRDPGYKVSPDTKVLGFSTCFHWIRVNERPNWIEMYPLYSESGAV